MNQFKNDLNRELRTVALSNEKKQLIAKTAKRKTRRPKKYIDWKYRFVLATFTVFALGFSYLLWQTETPINGEQGEESSEVLSSINGSMVNNDYVKVSFIVIVFVVLRILLKRRLQKRNKGLPVCVKCGEEWSYKIALRQTFKNTILVCPYCAQKQYRTKNSIRESGVLNLYIPFMVFVPRLFDNLLLGIVIWLSCVAYLIVSISPYYVDTQEEDSTTEPLW